MYGAAVGDFVGSRFEWHPHKSKDFDLVHEGCFWTDDTVLTIAVADAIATKSDMAETLRRYTLEHVTSYGPHYWDWANGRLGDGPYGSWGNGASMRVSPAAWFASDIHECLMLAKLSASVSHDHPEAIRGAQAVATAIYAGLSGWSQAGIRNLLQRTSGYDLSLTVDDLRPVTEFELKSWISVPRAIICALEATSFEDAVRNAVSIGGDADTEAAIAGSIAEAIFGVPEDLAAMVVGRLPQGLQERLIQLSVLAQAVDRKPFKLQEAEAIPAWNPDCVERWQRVRAKPRPIIIYEPDDLPEINATGDLGFDTLPRRIGMMLRGIFGRT